MEERVNRLRELKIPLERLATIVHPTATIADDVVIGAGTVVASNVTCQPGSHIGANCIIRAGACIGHDVVVDDYVDIGPNVSLAGYSKVQLGAQIAPNAVVRDNVVIGSFSVLGAEVQPLKILRKKQHGWAYQQSGLNKGRHEPSTCIFSRKGPKEQTN